MLGEGRLPVVKCASGDAADVPFQIKFTPSAEGDLAHFRAADRRVILDAIRVHLTNDATTESRRRKRLD
jgi:hypothetical protein